MTGLCASCQPKLCPRLLAEEAKLKRFAEIDAAAAKGAYEAYDPLDPHPKRVPPPGYRNATDADLESLNIPRGMLDNPELKKGEGPSNFRAAVYVEERTGKVLIAFKGTNPTSLEDWNNNRLQAFGQPSPYYTQAQEIAKRARLAVGDKVSFTGHSLGGGLALAAAAATGSPATTFNAAGLHPSTVLAPTSGGEIDTVYVRGEVLTGAQSLGQHVGLPAAKGTEDWPLDPPRGYGRALIAGGALLGVKGVAAAMAIRAVGLHMMGAVDRSLAERRAAVAKAIDANGCRGAPRARL